MPSTLRPQLVAVIASAADLRLALRIPEPPDFFELRLDALGSALDATEQAVAELRGRIIVTARHPAEGGANSLPLRQRRALLQRFLPHADYVDVELRSARALADLLDAARNAQTHTILSFHDLRAIPSAALLRRKLRSPMMLRADIFKIAVRVETASELARLLAFFEQASRKLPTAAMGIGRLGRRSRVELARAGSVLNYVYLAQPQTTGQLSLVEARSALQAR